MGGGGVRMIRGESGVRNERGGVGRVEVRWEKGGGEEGGVGTALLPGETGESPWGEHRGGLVQRERLLWGRRYSEKHDTYSYMEKEKKD